jgi:uncharacterized protein (TIGR02246 family)
MPLTGAYVPMDGPPALGCRPTSQNPLAEEETVYRSSTVLLALVTVACSASPPVHDPATDVAAINKIREQEIAAFSAGQPDALVAVFTDNAVVLPPGEAQLNSREAIRSWAQNLANEFTVRGGYTGSDVQVVGDWAIERYTGFLTVTPKKGGPPVEDHLRGIHVYQRQADGSWRITQDIWNSEPALAAKK